MSALNSNNTFDGLDEPVRPTPGGRKRRLDKENHKKQQKKKVRHSGGALIPTVGCQHKAGSVYLILAPINVYDNLNNLLSQASAKTVCPGWLNIMLRLLRLAQREEVVHSTVRSTTGEGNSLLSTSSLLPAGPAIMGREEHQAASISPVT